MSAPVLALILSIGGASEAAAQRGTEIGVLGVVTASDPALAVAGAFAALRTSRRTRVSIGAGAGMSDGDAAWRGELLAHFLLSPGRRRGVGLYGAGGVAVVGGPVEQGYVVLALGVESRPGARSGWFAEAGVGGGVRLAIGYRWRSRVGATEVGP
ncbi:MAG TPA: hypothetical protein VMY76_08895 [Gemmatimonadales bacterium]|nr:hypothetical protein [Gemmatimonadales bacterium]